MIIPAGAQYACPASVAAASHLRCFEFSFLPHPRATPASLFIMSIPCYSRFMLPSSFFRGYFSQRDFQIMPRSMLELLLSKDILSFFFFLFFHKLGRNFGGNSIFFNSKEYFFNKVDIDYRAFSI